MTRHHHDSTARTTNFICSLNNIFLFVLTATLTIAGARKAQAQWVGAGPSVKNIRAIAQAPGSPNTLFAGSFGWGVFVSTDAGANWTNFKAGLTNTYVRCIAARTAAVIICGTNDNLARSIDGGSTWSIVQPTAFSVRAVVCDPSTGHWFAGTYGDDLYKSLNDGVSWSKIIVTDLIANQTLKHIRTVARFGADSIYVGGSITDISSGGALFVSHNGGATWSQVQVGTGVRSTVVDVSISPNTPASSFIFGTASNGMYKSTDGGATILSINAELEPQPLPDLQISATGFSNGYRMCGTDSTFGCYLRALGDTTIGWNQASGLSGATTPVEAILPLLSFATVFLGSDRRGTYRSIDSGKTFSKYNNGMLGVDARDIEFTATGRAIVATGFGDKILHSDNGGVTWTTDSLTSFNSLFRIAKSSSGVFYAAQYGSGILKSVDQGLSWQLTDTLTISQYVRTVVVDPLNSNTVYAGTGSGVYKSSTAGASWTLINNGTIPAGTSVRSMAASPLTSGLILAGSDSSFLFRSTNGGSTWTHISNTSGFISTDNFIRSITFDPVSASKAYCGVDSGRIYLSLNGGTTWSLFVQLPTAYSVREILVDPGNTSRIFAATFGGGLFITEDGGVHWIPNNAGLADLQLWTVSIKPFTNPLELWVGTSSRGSFHRIFSGLPPDEKPILLGPATGCVRAGQTLSLVYVAVDADPTDTLRFSKTGPGLLNSTAKFTPDTARISWTPTVGDIAGSPYIVRIIVDDSRGKLDTVETTVEVKSSSDSTACATCCALAGDADSGLDVSIGDVTYLIAYIFTGGPAPACVDQADADSNNSVDIGDVTYLISYIFSGGPVPICGTTGH